MSFTLESTTRQESETIVLGDVPIARLGMEETLDLLTDWAGGDRPRRVATANVDFLRNASRHRGLRTALRSADLVTADGFPLVVLSRIVGAPIAERVAGADLVPALARRLATSGHSIYLLGGREGVGRDAARALQKSAPGLNVAGVSSPFIDWSDEAQASAVARDVRASGAQAIFVALGSPRQELFLSRWLAETGCALGVGVGGTLDFLAQPERRAPRWIQAMGFEWAHRLCLEPRRLAGRYLADAAYLARLSVAELRSSFSRRSAIGGGAS